MSSNYLLENPDLIARKEASSAQGAAQSAKTEIIFLKKEVKRLLMITEGLWELLKRNSNVTDEELHQKIVEIDLRDGKVDGRVKASPPGNCPKCNHLLTKRNPICMYCGEVVQRGVFER